MRPLTETDAPMRYTVFATRLGAVGIAWSDRGITRLQLPEASRSVTERRLRGRSQAAEAGEPPAQVRQAISQIERYLEGDATDFSAIELDLAGVGALHQEIYRALQRVGWGATTTYGALARQVGHPDASRAVGQAMGRNPVPIIIPCHRVLASNGKLGGFSAFGGGETKQRLLALEGVHPAAAPRLPGF
jgi:methylated-DNA-[protein]-cysteine S-methyltransferase